MSREATYLVTGSLGCIGAWALRHLQERGIRAVSLDLSNDRRRLDLLMDRGDQEQITFVQGAISDFDLVLDTIRDHAVTNVVHLAALQVPSCKADPVTGAHVNVVGTVNIFEAARQAGLRHVAFASSIAAFGQQKRGDADSGRGGGLQDDYDEPATLYGVYKRANEGTARVFWQDHGLSSIGLRPYTVYGVGRDQGLTSEPTKAMLAAAAGKPFEIGFGGRMQFHFASDVARQFIEAAAAPVQAARVFNLGGAAASIAEIVDLIQRFRPGSNVSYVDAALPFAEQFPSEDLTCYVATAQTPLEEGLWRTIEQFEELLRNGQLTA
jgi:nucleoside-diphosphate-sugar epimerase